MIIEVSLLFAILQTGITAGPSWLLSFTTSPARTSVTSPAHTRPRPPYLTPSTSAICTVRFISNAAAPFAPLLLPTLTSRGPNLLINTDSPIGMIPPAYSSTCLIASEASGLEG